LKYRSGSISQHYQWILQDTSTPRKLVIQEREAWQEAQSTTVAPPRTESIARTHPWLSHGTLSSRAPPLWSGPQFSSATREKEGIRRLKKSIGWLWIIREWFWTRMRSESLRSLRRPRRRSWKRVRDPQVLASRATIPLTLPKQKKWATMTSNIQTSYSPSFSKVMNSCCLDLSENWSSKSQLQPRRKTWTF